LFTPKSRLNHADGSKYPRIWAFWALSSCSQSRSVRIHAETEYKKLFSASATLPSTRTTHFYSTKSICNSPHDSSAFFPSKPSHINYMNTKPSRCRTKMYPGDGYVRRDSQMAVPPSHASVSERDGARKMSSPPSLEVFKCELKRVMWTYINHTSSCCCSLKVDSLTSYLYFL
jgi:hypothetical protein